MTPLGFVLLGALALFIVGAWLMKRNKFTELPPVSAKTPHTSHSFQFGYLLLIFVMATSLGFCDHLITLLLKTLLKQHVTSSGGYDSLAYAQLMGQYSMYRGCLRLPLPPYVLDDLGVRVAKKRFDFSSICLAVDSLSFKLPLFPSYPGYGAYTFLGRQFVPYFPIHCVSIHGSQRTGHALFCHKGNGLHSSGSYHEGAG